MEPKPIEELGPSAYIVDFYYTRMCFDFLLILYFFARAVITVLFCGVIHSFI